MSANNGKSPMPAWYKETSEAPTIREQHILALKVRGAKQEFRLFMFGTFDALNKAYLDAKRTPALQDKYDFAYKGVCRIEKHRPIQTQAQIDAQVKAEKERAKAQAEFEQANRERQEYEHALEVKKRADDLEKAKLIVERFEKRHGIAHREKVEETNKPEYPEPKFISAPITIK